MSLYSLLSPLQRLLDYPTARSSSHRRNYQNKHGQANAPSPPLWSQACIFSRPVATAKEKAVSLPPIKVGGPPKLKPEDLWNFFYGDSKDLNLFKAPEPQTGLIFPITQSAYNQLVETSSMFISHQGQS